LFSTRINKNPRLCGVYKLLAGISINIILSKCSKSVNAFENAINKVNRGFIKTNRPGNFENRGGIDKL